MEFTPKEQAHVIPSDREKYDALAHDAEQRLNEAHRAIRQSREIIAIGDAAFHEVPRALRGARQDIQDVQEKIGELEKLLPKLPETKF